MEKEEETMSVENGSEKQVKEENVLEFLDSVDSYLTLLDSLSSTLRQGWLELASARHSMGASRINSSLLDLKVHSAATTLQLSQQDVDPVGTQNRFVLHKWVSSDNGEFSSGEAKSYSSQLRHRHNPQLSEEKALEKNERPMTLDGEVQKQRSKSLAMFGALISPRLRAAQVSFETALETIVEIANTRSTVLSTFDQVHKELEGTKG